MRAAPPYNAARKEVRVVPTAFFEDLQIDQRIVVGKWSVSKEEAVAFARTWEPQPYHVDEAAARNSIYGSLTVCSLYLFAICTRLFFDYRPPIAVVAMLGKDHIVFPHPARVGDQLVYETACVDKRVSRTKPDRGIVTLVDRLSNVTGDVVLSQEVKLLVLTRPA